MAEDLDALWNQAKPVAKPAEDLDALWHTAKPVPVRGESNPGPAGEWATEQETEARGPTQGHAAINGFVGGATKRFADEMAGKTYEIGNYLRNLVHGVPKDEAVARKDEDYTFGRGSAREDMEKSEKAWPKTSMASGMAGDLATDVVAASAGVPVFTPAGMALSGGLSGLGASEAELTTGDPREFGKAAVSAGGGAALGYGLGKGGEVLGGLAQGAGRKLGRAVGDAMNATKAAREEALASGVGVGRQATGEGHRIIELAARAATDPRATPEIKALAENLLDSEQGRALLNQVYRNSLERAPEQLSKIHSAKEALGPLREALAPEALTAATDEALSHPIQPIVNFAKNYGSRVIPPAVGGVVGGPLGVVGGGVAGAVMGNPGTAAKGVVGNPAVRRAWWGMLQGILKGGGAALGKMGPYLAKEYQANPENARALDEALTAENPEYAARRLKLLQGENGDAR